MEGLRGRAVPNSAGPPAGKTGRPAHAAFGAYGGHARDGSSQRPGPTSWGDVESYPGGGRCLWRACEARHFPTARAHQLGGRGVLPRRRSVAMERLRGTGASLLPPDGGPWPLGTAVPLEPSIGTGRCPGTTPRHPAGGPGPLEPAVPRKPSIGSERHLGRTPRPPS